MNNTTRILKTYSEIGFALGMGDIDRAEKIVSGDIDPLKVDRGRQIAAGIIDVELDFDDPASIAPLLDDVDPLSDSVCERLCDLVLESDEETGARMVDSDCDGME